MLLYRALVFFFQAEDGIRDLTVTGVQTCALPISQCRAGRPAHRAHAAGPLAPAPRPDAARRRRAPGRAGLPGHLLHRQAQGRRQGLADHGLRCGELVWCRPHLARARAHRSHPLLAAGPAAGPPPGLPGASTPRLDSLGHTSTTSVFAFRFMGPSPTPVLRPHAVPLEDLIDRSDKCNHARVIASTTASAASATSMVRKSRIVFDTIPRVMTQVFPGSGIMGLLLTSPPNRPGESANDVPGGRVTELRVMAGNLLPGAFSSIDSSVGETFQSVTADKSQRKAPDLGPRESRPHRVQHLEAEPRRGHAQSQ